MDVESRKIGTDEPVSKAGIENQTENRHVGTGGWGGGGQMGDWD